MTTYIVTDQATGQEVYRYQADAPNPSDMADPRLAVAEEITFIYMPDVQEVPAPMQPVKVTKLAFRNRFTQAEKVGIEIASLDDPTAPMQARAGAAALRANSADITAASFIDLTYPDTRAGVQTLEAYGLIGAGRATEILDTPPTESELFNG